MTGPRLHWRGEGCNGEHVRDVAQREHVCWRAQRGQWLAGVYLRRDGQWSWGAHLTRLGDLEPDLHRDLWARPPVAIASTVGLARTRRDAQRRARKALARLDAQARLARSEGRP